MENIEMLQQELDKQNQEERNLVEEIKKAEQALNNTNKSLSKYQNIQNKINNATIANQKYKEILKSIKTKIDECEKFIGTDTIESLNENFINLQTEADKMKEDIDKITKELTLKSQEERKLNEMKIRISNQEKRNSALKEKLDSLKVNK